MLRSVLRASALAFLVAACSACPGPAPQRAPGAAPTAAPARDDFPKADILLARARALRAEGDAAGAQARLEAALQAAPGREDVSLELAELLVVEGRELERAEALLASVARRDVRWHEVRGSLAEQRGDAAAAAQAYADALTLGAGAELRVRRADALEKLGRGGEALGELEAAARDRPDDPIVRARLADGYEAAGRLAEAEALLRAEAEETPPRAAAWDRLARFYRRAGREAEARQASQRADEVAGRPERRVLRPLRPTGK